MSACGIRALPHGLRTVRAGARLRAVGQAPRARLVSRSRRISSPSSAHCARHGALARFVLRVARCARSLGAMTDAGSSSDDGDGAAVADTLTTARDLIAQLKALASGVAAEDARAISLLLTEARECFESAPERTFCLSAKVIIQGLHSRPELNGQSAVINGLSSNSTGRFSLVTASGEVLKIKPANLVLASTSPAPSQSQSQATTVEPMHSVKGLPAGWT